MRPSGRSRPDRLVRPWNDQGDAAWPVASSACCGRPPRGPDPGSNESNDLMRNVWLFERGNLLGREFDINSCDSVVEMLQLGGADDWRGDDLLGPPPGHVHPLARDAARRLHFSD